MRNFTLQKSILLLFLAFLFTPMLQAQTYTGNLSLSSQAAVDAFSYTEVTGNLTIGPDSSQLI